MLTLGACLGAAARADDCVVASFADSTAAPHGRGNVYAPEIVRFRGELLMFFGGQGSDGHDRIHLATSTDGKHWKQCGVVFAPAGVNHVNDPSVVAVDGGLYLFYTRAGSGVTDSIGLAKSPDGRHWKDLGTVFRPADAPAWDALLVGRPSVIYDGSLFRMWYDGRKDLPAGAPDANAPKSNTSTRSVGYATSPDGVTWTRRPEPVYGENAGGVHVSRIGDALIMVIESRAGTKWASSRDGVTWKSRGLLRAKDQHSPHGHVTPFLFVDEKIVRLYYGAAAAENWNQNAIYAADVKLPRAGATD